VVKADRAMGAIPPIANPAMETNRAKKKKLEPDKMKPQKHTPVTNNEGIITGFRPTRSESKGSKIQPKNPVNPKREMIIPASEMDK
jgi:hypothetical protein